MNQSEVIVLSPLLSPQFQYSFSHYIYSPHHEPTENPHIHNCYEIYVNVTGDVAFLVNNRLYPVESGDVVVTRPGDVHLCVYQSKSAHERFCFWLNCPEDSPLVAFTQQKDFSSLIHFSDDTRQEILHLLFKLNAAEATSKEPGRSACVFRFLTLLNERGQTDQSRLVLPEDVQQVLDFIHENYTQLRGLDDIVNATHISSSTLNRWFRRYLQLSPHKYIEALKLAFAQQLLLAGCSVTQACDRSGFSDCSRFIAVFKNKFGQTPLQYQKGRQSP